MFAGFLWSDILSRICNFLKQYTESIGTAVSEYHTHTDTPTSASGGIYNMPWILLSLCRDAVISYSLRKFVINEVTLATAAV